MESVYAMTYLNISLFPCGVNILRSRPVNETQSATTLHPVDCTTHIRTHAHTVEGSYLSSVMRWCN